MKQKSGTQKTTQRNSPDVDHVAAAGAKGMALAPPAYGIDSVDQGLTEARTGSGTVTQRQADMADTGGDTGARSENKTGLPDNLKAGIESLSGLALDDVRVHYNSDKPAQLQALAYTQGTEIYLAPGQERHLPHEAWHVVQQAQGRVRPTLQMREGVHVNDDKVLEQEAAVMGRKARANVVRPRAGALASVSDHPVVEIVQRRKIASDWEYNEQVDYQDAEDTIENLREWLKKDGPNYKYDEEDIANIESLRKGEGLIYPRKEEFSDEEIEYGKRVKNWLKRGHVLAKRKDLYGAPNMRAKKIALLDVGRVVTVLDKPSRANKRSLTWARIMAEVNGEAKIGYINTGAARREPLYHVPLDGAIMPKDGPKPEHVKQNMFPSCFLLSALMSLTRKDPQYVEKELFKTDPTEAQEKHRVRFFSDESREGEGPFHDQVVAVDNSALKVKTGYFEDRSPMQEGTNYGAKGDHAWPAVIEKAFAAWPGKSSADNFDEGGQGRRAAGYLTGEAHMSVSSDEPDKNRLKKQLIEAVRDRKSVVTAATKGDAPSDWGDDNSTGLAGEKMIGGIAFGHVYEIVSADDDLVTLRNPWGQYGRVNRQEEKESAESKLSWEEFFRVISSWSLLNGEKFREKYRDP